MTKGILRTRRAGVGFLAALIATAGLIPLAPGAGAAPNLTVTRFAGTDRFDTARLVAGAFGASPNVVIARGDVFADALAGGYVAGLNNAAILLVRSDSVPAATTQALNSAGATRAIIMGGTTAVSTAVENALRSRPMTVERISGPTRYETAAAAAQSGPATGIGNIDGKRTAMVARGDQFPDALSGSPLAYAAKLPIILTPGGASSTLHPAARSALSALQITNVLILGGDQAVSQAVETEIKALGISVNRLAGGVRTATSVAIAEFAITKLGFTTRRVGLARGDDFPDAMTYGPLAGKSRPTVLPGDAGTAAAGAAAPNPLLIASGPTALGQDAKDWLIKYSNDLTQLEILGGEQAISAAVAAEAAQAAQTGGAAFSFSSTSTQPGGTISGTVTGQNIQSVTVQGCGITTPQTLSGLSSTGGTFTVQIPASQPNNQNCTLTFTTTFVGGRTETDTQNIAVGNPPPTTTTQPGQTTTTQPGQTTTTQPGQTTTTTTTPPSALNQGVSAGQQLRTGAPDLLSVGIINGAPNDAVQNAVRFTYDEAVVTINNTAPGCPGPNSAGTACSTRFSLQGFDSNTRLDNSGVANIDPADPNSVIVQFPEATDIRPFTIGTSDAGAVTDGTNPSVLASKALGGSTFGGQAGRTAAPDLVGVSVDQANQQITYTFDQPVQNPTATQFGFYTESGSRNTGNTIVALSGTQNAVTVAFGGDPGAGVGTDPVQSAVRYFVNDQSILQAPGDGDSAVEGTTAPSRDNPLGHTGGATQRPDLISATKVAGQPSQIDYTFDEVVDATTAVPAQFAAYQDDGLRFDGDAVAQNGPNTLRVTFNTPASELNQNNIAQIVLAGVEAGAVNSAGEPGQTNTEGAQPLTSTGAAAGFTDGPDLIGAIFNAGSNQVTFQFDESVDDTATFPANPASYFIVSAAGTTLATGTALTISGSNVTVTFPGNVAAAAGAGVVSLTGFQTGVVSAPAAQDFQGNDNSPDSVGGGPAPG